jgi:ADP-dependent NAD(P)H-hydrate dehydratase
MAEPVQVGPDLLHEWPLPEPGSDKHARGTVLMVGGSSSVPGALMLAGEAALRAGAGKLQLATTRSVAEQVAVTVPEALVRRLDEDDSGDIAASAADEVVEQAESASALLLGSGMLRPHGAAALLAGIVPRVDAQAVVIDALASAYVTEDHSRLHHLRGGAVLTVNPREVARTLGVDDGTVTDDPVAAATELAGSACAVVLCGGEQKVVAHPDGRGWVLDVGGPGLGVSGSGDVQAGIVAGLLARGASVEQAAVWGAWLHGRAGEVLAEEVGPVGFLARELPPVVPRLLARTGG